MKKLLIALSLVLVVSIAGFSFVGCKKSTETNEGPKQEQTDQGGNQGGEQGGEQSTISYIGTWKASGLNAFAITMDETAYNALLTQYGLMDDGKVVDENLSYDSMFDNISKGFSYADIDLVIIEEGTGYLWQVWDDGTENPFSKIAYEQNTDGSIKNLVLTSFVDNDDVVAAYVARGYSQDEIAQLDSQEDIDPYINTFEGKLTLSAVASGSTISANVTALAQSITAEEFNYENGLRDKLASVYEAYGLAKDTAADNAQAVCDGIVKTITSATCTMTLQQDAE